MKKKILPTFYFIFILFNSSYSQVNIENDINVAFRKARKLNKELLVIRTDSNEKPNKYKIPSQLYLDSIFKDAGSAQKINERFVVFKFEYGKEYQIKHSAIQNLIPAFPPLIYCFTEDSLLFYKGYVLDKSKRFVENLLDSIDAHQSDIKLIKNLQNKVTDKTIDITTLFDYIKMRYRLGNTFNNELELYLRKGGKFNSDLAEMLSSEDWIPLDGYFFQTILNKQKKNIDENLFINSAINRSIESSTFTTDERKFKLAIQCLEKEASLNEEIKSGILSSFTESNLALKGRILYAKFIFSDSSNDNEGIQKYGVAYVDYLNQTYKQRLEEATNKSEVMMDYVMLYGRSPNENMDSTKKRLKDYLDKGDERQRQMVDNFNSDEAQILNEICWTFYLKVKDKTSLAKALDWSEKTVQFAKSDFYKDTYAHLHFVLGNKSEAIIQEKIALEIAQKRNDIRMIKEYTAELEKFQSN